MKVIKKYNQYRRDCTVDLECESCGNKKTYKDAYDDRYFWDNVVSDMKCEECGKSSNDLGITNPYIETRYPEGMTI